MISHWKLLILVRPILEYASIIWDPHTDTNIHKLEMVQRRSARNIMHNYNRHASVTTMLQHIDLPTLQQRRQHSKIIMLYRIRDQLASIPTAIYIRPSPRNTQHYILPYARTLVFQTSFFPSTIKIWNNLQPVITNSTTIPRLRKALQSTPTSGRRGATLSALVRCLSVLNVHFCKKSQKLAQMTFDRYLSNHDIGRTFCGGLTPSN